MQPSGVLAPSPSKSAERVRRRPAHATGWLGARRAASDARLWHRRMAILDGSLGCTSEYPAARMILAASRDVVARVEHPFGDPDVIVNPVSGQTVTFLSTAPEILRTRFEVESGRATDPRHIHPRQVETITVIRGRIRLSLADNGQRVLEPGQSWEIPCGTPHTWAAIDSHVELQIEFRPALRTRRLMTRLFGLAEAGRTNSRGMPNPLQVSLIALEFEREFRLASPPWRVQKLVLTALAPLARTFGYRP